MDCRSFFRYILLNVTINGSISYKSWRSLSGGIWKRKEFLVCSGVYWFSLGITYTPLLSLIEPTAGVWLIETFRLINSCESFITLGLLKKGRQTTFMCTTHYLDDAHKVMCDRIALSKTGKFGLPRRWTASSQGLLGRVSSPSRCLFDFRRLTAPRMTCFSNCPLSSQFKGWFRCNTNNIYQFQFNFRSSEFFPRTFK